MELWSYAFEVVEIGDSSTLDELSVAVATEGASACGGTPYGPLNINSDSGYIESTYSAAGAKSACMDVVLTAGNQKSPPEHIVTVVKMKVQ